MYLNNGSANITIDLNGHSIKCNKAREYDIFAENSNITITDSSNSKKSVISGISVSNTNLTVNNVIIDNSTGAGLFAQKGSSSSCDPTIGGKITITNNRLTNGTLSNAFLQENSTSKCIFKLSENRKLDSSSRIGITSNTNDKCLDIVKIFSKDSYNRTKNVFSYDTSKYKINRYSPWYSDLYWIEIKK